MRHVSRFLVALLILGLAMAPAAAKDKEKKDKFEGQTHESRILSDSFLGTIGGFGVGNTTDVAVGLFGPISAVISLESDLGLERKRDTLLLDGFWRFARKHAFGWQVFAFDRTASRMINEDIVFENDETGETITLNAGATVDSEWKSGLVGFTYQYSFINDGKTEAGILGGLNVCDFEIMLKGTATIDDGMGGISMRSIEPDASLVAPVPSAGIFLRHAFTPKFLIRIGAQVFDVDYQDLSGRFVSTQVFLDYFFTRHFGIGGGWTVADIQVTEGGSEPWSVAYKYGGGTFYFSGVF